jgi:hypothetical protein
MGQQQILLLILVVVVVGIATLIGINIMQKGAEKANHDALVQDLAQIASTSLAWYSKPRMIGGGGNSFENVTFRDFSFPRSGISADGKTISNLNGFYFIESSEPESLVVLAYNYLSLDSDSDSSGPKNLNAGPGNNSGIGVGPTNPNAGPGNNSGIGVGPGNNPNSGDQPEPVFKAIISKSGITIERN